MREAEECCSLLYGQCQGGVESVATVGVPNKQVQSTSRVIFDISYIVNTMQEATTLFQQQPP